MSVQHDPIPLNRVPVEYTSEGYEAIMTSGQEAVKLPQALGEIFAAEGLDVTITIDCDAKAKFFPGCDSAERVLLTLIRPRVAPATVFLKDPLVIYTNLADLGELRINQRYGFHAANTAKEFVRSYKQYYGIN
jgi:hypothetical protein